MSTPDAGYDWIEFWKLSFDNNIPLDAPVVPLEYTIVSGKSFSYGIVWISALFFPSLINWFQYNSLL